MNKGSIVIILLNLRKIVARASVIVVWLIRSANLQNARYVQIRIKIDQGEALTKLWTNV